LTLSGPPQIYLQRYNSLSFKVLCT